MFTKIDAQEILTSFVSRIIQMNEVEGVVVLGGLGEKDHFDLYSDIDLAIFLDTRETSHLPMNHWLPRFEFTLVLYPKDGVQHKIGLNVHQQVLLEERYRQWDESKKEAYSKGRIVYDKAGNTNAFLQEKLIYDDVERTRRLTELVAQFPPFSSINPRRQTLRGLFYNAHDILNTCGEMIVDALFRYNRRFIPVKKWRLEESFSLPWTPPNYRDYMIEGMLVKSHDNADIERRIHVLKKIITPLEQKILSEPSIPDDPYDYACKNYWGRQVVSTPFSVLVNGFLGERGVVMSEEIREAFLSYIDYNLYSSYSDLFEGLISDVYFKNILSQEDILHIVGVLREVKDDIT